MKKINLIPTILLLIGMTVATSCKKNQNPENQILLSSENSIKAEGYHPESAGKIIKAYYLNRLVDLLEVDNGKYLFGGDILLEAKDIIVADGPLKPRTEGTIHNGLWKNKTVYYKFYTGKTKTSNGSAVSQTFKDMWTSATAMWKSTGVIFTEAGVNSTNYIYLYENNTGDAYSTSLGNGGGVQVISMDVKAFKAGNLAHEIGHNLGLEHEQGRLDRDLFVNVDFTKIGSNWTYQYLTKTGSVGVGPFDFGSIMLYPSDNSLSKLDGTGWPYNRAALTAGDKQAVKYWYEKDTNIKTGNYKFTPYGAPDRVLEVEYRKSDALAKIVKGVNVITDTLITAANAANYTWELTHVSDGYYKLLSLIKDKDSVSKTLALTMNDKVVTIGKYVGSSGQLWRIVPGYKDGYYKLYTENNPLYRLDEGQGPNFPKSNFNTIQTDVFKISDGQEWKFTEVVAKP